MGNLGQGIGLVHELRQLRGAEEFTHRRRRWLGIDQVVRHDRVDIDAGHTLLDRPLHTQQANPVLVFQQFADRTHPAIAEIIDIVDFAATIAQAHQGLEHGQDVFLTQDPHLVRGVLFQAHIHLDPANGRQVIALGVKEQALKHGLGRFHGRWLAGTHDAIDIEQGVFAGRVLIDAQGVAHIGPDRDMVDIEHVNRVKALFGKRLDRNRVQLVARLGIDFAGFVIDRVAGQITRDQGVWRQKQGLDAAISKLLGRAGADLLASRRNLFARIRIDQGKFWLHTAPALWLVGRGPTAIALFVRHDIIEGGEDFFAIHAQRIEEGGGGQLAATVNPHIDHILGIEFKIEPRAAIRNDPGRKQQLARGMGLALIVIKEHAGRTVHLRDDDALSAIDDKGALIRHERDIAHIDVLLFNVLDRAGAGFFVRFKHDQAQLDLKRRGIGHVALGALFHIVFGRLKFIGHIFEHCALVKVLDREYRFEHGLNAFVAAVRRADFALKELFIRRALNLDQVRHGHGFRNATERLPDPLFAGE